MSGVVWPEWVDRLIWPRVEKRDDGCWVWLGAKSRAGYAINGTARKHTGTTYVHRALLILMGGPIEPGYEVDHLCFTPSCVNPDHLRLLTVTENRMRRPQKGRTHCLRGHPMTGDNVIHRSDGKRRCRVCYEAWRRTADDTAAEVIGQALAESRDAAGVIDALRAAGYVVRRIAVRERSDAR